MITQGELFLAIGELHAQNLRAQTATEELSHTMKELSHGMEGHSDGHGRHRQRRRAHGEGRRGDRH